jgi:hypothetical protein
VALAVAPQAGWRHAWIGALRPAIDVTGWLTDLLDVHSPDAERIRLVADTLTTHSPGGRYAAFSAPAARRLVQKIEWHDSWLTMGDRERAVLATQCLDRR